MQTLRVALLVSALVILHIVTVAGKGGTCPDPKKRGAGLCTSTCKADDGCAGYLKCCPNSCGAFTCAFPENIDLNEYPAEKQGKCPSVTQRGFCTSTCKADKDCTGSLKCCTNSCGASVCSFPAAL